MTTDAYEYISKETYMEYIQPASQKMFLQQTNTFILYFYITTNVYFCIKLSELKILTFKFIYIFYFIPTKTNYPLRTKHFHQTPSTFPGS